MSATEIIEQFRRLPSAEQTRVLECLQRAIREKCDDEPQVRCASDEVFDKAAERVLNTHADLFRRLAQ